MAVSRPVVLALLGVALAAALFYATMGAREASDDSSPPATAAVEGSAPKAKAARKGASQPKAARGASEAKAARRAGAAKRRALAARARPAETKPAAPIGVPAAVTRALGRKRTVVLFFFQRGSADDDATARAVDSVRGRPGVEVFSAPISRLADYRGVTGGAGVSQAPAVVILGRGGSARLIEGFVDSETLVQEVTDAR